MVAGVCALCIVRRADDVGLDDVLVTWRTVSVEWAFELQGLLLRVAGAATVY